ncbi:MAG: 3-deoxy-7-phosphoheptulonate synthase [Gammaproteobacteria bacterium]|nr:3-deoxy-7-phosphoheptulonate synthase [Gammaproteobacteria bacterium]
MFSIEQQLKKADSSELNQEFLVAPKIIKTLCPIDKELEDFVTESRVSISNILKKNDSRILVVVGPCSIHDPKAALEYAKKLRVLAKLVEKNIFIVMRVYFAKPRTSIGWQGFISDPYLDNSNKINDGLLQARELLVKINQLGLPAATEFLDCITSKYLLDLISWGAIGARTVESQMHRNFVSGLDLPVGFKNSTNGEITTAVEAIFAASQSHLDISINDDGQIISKQTIGNKNTHIVLRGGKITGPNYKAQDILEVVEKLEKLRQYKINNAVMVDCSHGNSEKNYLNQKNVFYNILDQLKQKHDQYIKGLMLESFLHPGRQELDLSNLAYGVSVTDSCIGWEETCLLINELHNNL